MRLTSGWQLVVRLGQKRIDVRINRDLWQIVVPEPVHELCVYYLGVLIYLIAFVLVFVTWKTRRMTGHGDIEDLAHDPGNC
jgi:hypothetical protein